MNPEDRIKYYMKGWYTKTISLEANLSQVSDLKNTCTLLTLSYDTIKKLLHDNTSYDVNNYFIPLFNTWDQINKIHMSKHIIFMHGDISHYQSIPTLVKDRICDDENGIIVNVNVECHWGSIDNVKNNDIPYKNKINKIIWRGVTTGQPNKKGNRFDLVTKYFNYDSSVIDVGFNRIVQNKEAYLEYVREYSTSMQDQLQCKYILSVEGNDVASGGSWKLTSNSLVIMPKPTCVTWLMQDLLVPYVHYIQVKDDFSDLVDIYNWCNNNEQKCEEIINNAHIFMKQFSDPVEEEYIHDEVLKRYMNNVTININLE